MEYWDLYDEQCRPMNKQVKKGTLLKEDEYHFAAELWIVNSHSQILIQQRSRECEILPGIWGLTTGRMIAGEDTLTGCVREAYEELQIRIDKRDLVFIDRIVRKDGTHLIWDVYCALDASNKDPESFVLQKEEVEQVKWVGKAELLNMIQQKQLFYYPEIEGILNTVTDLTARKLEVD